jgi:hypothetical protein
MRYLQHRATPILAATLLLVGLPTAHAFQESDRENVGFIYGHVTTRSGTEYTGFLRWGTEEHFWDDLFHSAKADLPYREEQQREEDRGVRIFGRDIRWGQHDHGSRIFIARFGDIEEIVVTDDERAEVRMKSGEIYEVEGYSNDVGGKVHVRDPDLGEIDLRWDRIDRIQFMQAPADAAPGPYRLHGTVETEIGEFQGFIQWDKQECVSSDVLDGEAEDGEVDIKMGRILSIERSSRRASIVELKDGRTVELRGSNDVNHENRGIVVEDPRYGRVTIPWDAFEKVTFHDPRGSGRSYLDYSKGTVLHGSVTDTDGNTHQGRIVIDLDESEDWEILNGSYRDVEYDIPLRLVARIEPLSRSESRVVLRTGEELELEEGQDVSDRNAGVLVFTADERDPIYVDWRDVERVEFAE